MKIVISPAKSLDFERQLPTAKYSQPIFLGEAEKINRLLRKKSAKSLSRLMDISGQLGQLNYERNQEWKLPFTSENARPAIYAFSGDVYRGLDAHSLSEGQIEGLQKSLRILSGQYGLLKPLDLMQPYRLEMGTKFPIGKNKDLYAFWKPRVTKALNEELEKNELFINLASTEYFKAIDTKKLKVPVANIVFKELKNGEYKTIMTYAKLARGYMVRYIIDKGVNTLEGLKGFDYEGYGFSEALSQKENGLVFVR